VASRAGRLTPALLVLLLVIAIAFVNARFDDSGIPLMDDIAWLKNWALYPLFYFIYRRCRQDLQVTRQLILLTLVVSAVAGIEAIYQGVQFGLGDYSHTGRAAGPFGDHRAANRAGVFFAMFLPMFLAIVLFSRGRKLWRIVGLAGCGLLLFAIMLTYSRQAYLIALVATFLLLFRRSMMVAALLGVIMVASVSLLPSSVMYRIETTQQQTVGGDTELDPSTASRFHIWAGAMDMWRDNPAGVGLNRFKQHIGDYSAYKGMDAHNSFVLILAECGPLGLAALLWLYARMWTLTRRMRAAAHDPEARALALGFTFMVFAAVLGNLFSSFFFDGTVMGNFWVLCGLLERYTAMRVHAYQVQAAAAEAAAPAPALGEQFPLAARAQPGHSPLPWYGLPQRALGRWR
jgi:O-antigen ligase